MTKAAQAAVAEAMRLKSEAQEAAKSMSPKSPIDDSFRASLVDGACCYLGGATIGVCVDCVSCL